MGSTPLSRLYVSSDLQGQEGLESPAFSRGYVKLEAALHNHGCKCGLNLQEQEGEESPADSSAAEEQLERIFCKSSFKDLKVCFWCGYHALERPILK